MAPQSPWGFVPKVVLSGGGGTFKKWCLSVGLWATGDVLKASCETPALASFLLLLLGHEESSFALSRAPTMTCYLIQSNGTSQP
jgi:hypothetical protein